MKPLNKQRSLIVITFCAILLIAPMLMHAANIAVDQEPKFTTETQITPYQFVHFYELVTNNNTFELENFFAHLNQEQKNQLLITPIVTTQQKDTPLHYAARHGYRELVNVCIKHATVNIFELKNENGFGGTPLYIACQEGKTEIVRELLQHESGKNSINTRPSDGSTPLYIACQEGRIDILKELLTHEAGINSIIIKRNDGATPLAVACFYGHDTVVALLLPHVTPEIINQHNNNPLQVTLINDDSRARGTYTSAALLLVHGANTEFANQFYAQEIQEVSESFTQACINALSYCGKARCLELLKNVFTKAPLFPPIENGQPPHPLALVSKWLNHTDPRKRLTTKQLGILFNDPNFYEQHLKTSGFSRSTVLPLQTLILLHMIKNQEPV